VKREALRVKREALRVKRSMMRPAKLYEGNIKPENKRVKRVPGVRAKRANVRR
jgi:hypothetical protein